MVLAPEPMPVEITGAAAITRLPVPEPTIKALGWVPPRADLMPVQMVQRVRLARTAPLWEMPPNQYGRRSKGGYGLWGLVGLIGLFGLLRGGNNRRSVTEYTTNRTDEYTHPRA
jgi:hypothetical protein